MPGSPRLAALLVLSALLPTPARADDRFSRDVAPLLRDRCVRCHNTEKSRGGLDLSTRKAMLRGGDSGPAVVPGKADASRLLEFVTGEKPRMPRGGRPLSAEQVTALRGWIDAGATWPEAVVLAEPRPEGGAWWSLQPLVRPAVPDEPNTRTPVDAFLRAKLRDNKLSPSAEADRRTLIRRLTFDLHGLPPTPAEIDAFLADRRPDAYELLVDRLLASPRYGERWGRHWLDVVHYGDTHGYDKDKRRDHAWPYRDYVIRAFNADKPYARFVQEQISGDVLFPGDPDALVATGFVTAGPWDFVGHVELREGTVDKMKTRVLDRDDMVTTTVSTFLSLTAHCARCHDHKFDPIPQRDYYRLQAVFAGVERGNRPYQTSEAHAKQLALEQRRKELLDKRAAIDRRAGALDSPTLRRLEAERRTAADELAALPPRRPGTPSRTNGYHSGIERKSDVTKWVQVDLGRPMPLDEIRLVPARPTDFRDSPGFGFPTRYLVSVSDVADFSQSNIVADHRAADVPNPGTEVVRVAAGGRTARYIRVTALRLWERTRDYVFALGEMQVLSGGKNVAAAATVTALDSIEAGRWSTRNLVDGHDSRHRLPDPADPDERLRMVLADRVRETEAAIGRERDALLDPAARRERAAIDQTLERLESERAALAAPAQVYAVVSVPSRPIHVLGRGNVEQPGEAVGAGALDCVKTPGGDLPVAIDAPEGARRAALAKWITDPRNPLTWRSIANRVWHYHFGRGIVDTPSDFGRMGSQPTHPELLDWLACEMRDTGSIKHLHRLIVCSAAYRQVSADDPASARVDSGNRLLWRMNRQRLDAEAVRDTVLAVSGRLDERIGGPGFPLFHFKDDHSPVYDHTAADALDHPDANRRTVYRFVVRSVPNPFLECLDCADPNLNVPVRNTTLTALQALALLNDPFMLRQAEAFAARLKAIDADPAKQIEHGYRLALGRDPTAGERDAVAGYAAKHGLPAACRLLFNLNEFVFMD